MLFFFYHYYFFNFFYFIFKLYITVLVLPNIKINPPQVLLQCRRTSSNRSLEFIGSIIYYQFSSVQSLSRVRLLATPWIEAHQASLSITNSQRSLELMSIKSVMPSSHLILCRPLLLLPPIPPSISVFSNESTLRMRWPKYWSFSLSISPSNEHHQHGLV